MDDLGFPNHTQIVKCVVHTSGYWWLSHKPEEETEDLTQD